ncbi:RNA pyrophosphohydrolase [Methyloligella sp. 2.7D]|uniref:RNA pyrophosphohydrolase n=1 Tax=unclassified Methyloligella TaxID=2625955 RepID=UPI00157C7D95|nr:RNA pyrophosphohydrolase [Methyloligella sp. GL2]QKP76366.1 RNA pyrophosphohydrolase [Methyloligella sp. GL2]
MSKVSADQLPYRPCVGVMLLNSQGRVFVGRRSDRLDQTEGEGNWWQMPQGGIDKGEDPEKAAKRELYEETGITSVEMLGHTSDWVTYDLPAHLVGVAWKGRYRGQKQMWFAARFEGDESEVDLSPLGHTQEFDAWKWVRLSDLPSLIVPFKRDVYEKVVAEFTPLVEAVKNSA